MVKPMKKLQIGKNGLTEAFIDQVKSIFEKEKVLKISILKAACRDKKDADKMAEELTVALGPKYGYKLIGYVITVIKHRKIQK
jgi:RNA-binding protein YhbY